MRANDTYRPNKDFGGIELAFNEGELLELTGKQAPEGWIFAAKVVRGKRVEGLIPADYVDESSGDEDEDDEDDEESMKSPAAAPGAAEANEDANTLPPEEGVMQCIEDFVPDEGGLNEQAITVGQLVEIIDVETPEGWLMVKVRETDSTGLVPESFLGPPPSREKNKHELEVCAQHDAEHSTHALRMQMHA